MKRVLVVLLALTVVAFMSGCGTIGQIGSEKSPVKIVALNLVQGQQEYESIHGKVGVEALIEIKLDALGDQAALVEGILGNPVHAILLGNIQKVVEPADIPVIDITDVTNTVEDTITPDSQ